MHVLFARVLFQGYKGPIFVMRNGHGRTDFTDELTRPMTTLFLGRAINPHAFRYAMTTSMYKRLDVDEALSLPQHKKRPSKSTRHSLTEEEVLHCPCGKTIMKSSCCKHCQTSRTHAEYMIALCIVRDATIDARQDESERRQ